MLSDYRILQAKEAHYKNNLVISTIVHRSMHDEDSI